MTAPQMVSPSRGSTLVFSSNRGIKGKRGTVDTVKKKR